MKAKKKYPVVQIIWLDSESHDSWKTEGELAADAAHPLNCFTIGFLVRKATLKSPTYYVASTVTDPPADTERQASCIMKIPSVCVKEIIEIDFEGYNNE